MDSRPPSPPKMSRTEVTPLLQPDQRKHDDETDRSGECDTSSTRLWLAEVYLLVSRSFPVVLAYMLQNSLQTVSILVVGRSSALSLAVASFSYMFAMCSGWLIALGGTTAMDTLASASYTGSKDKHQLGILLQRAIVILTLFYIPVATLWIFSRPMFHLFGQEEAISRESARFLTALVPGGLGYIYFEAMKKYLQAQAIMHAGTYVLLLVAPTNFALNYLFVFRLDMGLLGAPIATGLCYWLAFLLLLLYARFVEGSSCWGGWSWSCLKNSTVFARLAFFGVIQAGSEWWGFEIVALLAGRLGTTSLAAQSIVMATDQITNTIPFGISVVTSARVGNMLGARSTSHASRSASTAIWLSIAVGTLLMTILLTLRDVYPTIFTDDGQVLALTSKVMPYLAVFQIADGLNAVASGVLRGSGRQQVGALVNVIAYYAVALPLGVTLAFRGWGLSGLWLCLCLALYLTGGIEWIIVAFTNWESQVEAALARLDEETATV